jgi:hypothetical protein
MSAFDDPRTAQTLAAFADVVRSAEMMAGGHIGATHPRELIARRIRAFVRTFDRENGWPPTELGEPLRARALTVAAALDVQGHALRKGRR